MKSDGTINLRNSKSTNATNSMGSHFVSYPLGGRLRHLASSLNHQPEVVFYMYVA